MIFLRKLEVACGIATAGLGMAATGALFTLDVNISRRLGESFPVTRWLLGALILYILPGLLVALGSYIHASRSRGWGLPVLFLSSLLLTIMFVLLVLNVAFFATQSLFWLNFLFAALAIVTVILAMLVHFRDPA
jgi:hypothetical protein